MFNARKHEINYNKVEDFLDETYVDIDGNVEVPVHIPSPKELGKVKCIRNKAAMMQLSKQKSIHPWTEVLLFFFLVSCFLTQPDSGFDCFCHV